MDILHEESTVKGIVNFPMSRSHPVASIILAAGQGTRMKSNLPKVIHQSMGWPLVKWILVALDEAGVERNILVVGHGADQVKETLGDGYEYVLQKEQLGTGHAALMAKENLAGFSGSVLVLAGDTPLLKGETLLLLIEQREASGAKAVFATCELDDATGYGRVMRNQNGDFLAIVEHKDCTDEQLEVCEVNPAVYCFDAETLFEILPTLGNNNAQGEYYLPEVLRILAERGEHLQAVLFEDEEQFHGINDRWQLAQVSSLLKERIIKKHAQNGVTFEDLDSTFIGPEVQIGSDTLIRPNVSITGKTTIDSNCLIGPNSWIRDSVIGEGSEVFMSHLNQATVRQYCKCGPFANIRPDAVIGNKSKIGNFVEIKNAVLGEESAVSHLSYIGDAEIGDRTNIGAGTITCNYDGFKKSITKIGSECFIGSHSTLIAPVNIGDEAMVAAGSVVNRDVPDGDMAISRAKQENKEEWFRKWRQRKLASKQ